MRLRISISRMLAPVLAIAVGLAAAMAGAFPFAVVALSATSLGVLLSRGPRRAFFLGSSLFGWASLLLAFGVDSRTRNTLPTTRLIVRIYDMIKGPDPTVFPSQEEAVRYVMWVVQGVNGAITVGYSLISLAMALVGGAGMWLIGRRRKGRTATG